MNKVEENQKPYKKLKIDVEKTDSNHSVHSVSVSAKKTSSKSYFDTFNKLHIKKRDKIEAKSSLNSTKAMSRTHK